MGTERFELSREIPSTSKLFLIAGAPLNHSGTSTCSRLFRLAAFFSKIVKVGKRQIPPRPYLSVTPPTHNPRPRARRGEARGAEGLPRTVQATRSSYTCKSRCYIHSDRISIAVPPCPIAIIPIASALPNLNGGTPDSRLNVGQKRSGR